MGLVVAGLDVSLTRTGVAVLDADRKLHTYSFGYSLKRDSTERQRLERVVTVANQVMGVLLKHKPVAVGIENYAFKGQGLTLLADLTGTIKTQIYVALRSMPIVIPSSSIRKFLFKKNITDKNKIKQLIADMGFSEPKNTDESDAVAVALVIDAYKNFRVQNSDTHKMEVFERIDKSVS